MSTYIYNPIPHLPIEVGTPNYRIYGEHADLSHTRIIESKAFIDVHVQHLRSKLKHTKSRS